MAYHKGTTALCPYRSLNGRGSLLKRGHNSWRRPSAAQAWNPAKAALVVGPWQNSTAFAPLVAVVIAPSLLGAADTSDRQKPRR